MIIIAIMTLNGKIYCVYNYLSKIICLLCVIFTLSQLDIRECLFIVITTSLKLMLFKVHKLAFNLVYIMDITSCILYTIMYFICMHPVANHLKLE